MEFFCLDCMQRSDLDKHGRCGICGSNAVTEAEGRGRWPIADIADGAAKSLSGLVLASRSNIALPNAISNQWQNGCESFTETRSRLLLCHGGKK